MKIISCAFNMDTACVELKYTDGSMIAIDTCKFRSLSHTCTDI